MPLVGQEAQPERAARVFRSAISLRPSRDAKVNHVGSGSVITKDVPDDAMAVERSPQNNREGGAKRYREMKMRAKKPKED
jgi:serine acetyltransferase